MKAVNRAKDENKQSMSQKLTKYEPTVDVKDFKNRNEAIKP